MAQNLMKKAENVRPSMMVMITVAALLGMMGAGVMGAAHAQGGASAPTPQTPPQTSPQPQIQWIGDVPINPALTIEPGLGFAFDSPEGRVVMIVLSGGITASVMEAYYRQALPPLGWQQAGDMRWHREGEALLIQQSEAAGVPLWKITLRPE